MVVNFVEVLYLVVVAGIRIVIQRMEILLGQIWPCINAGSTLSKDVIIKKITITIIMVVEVFLCVKHGKTIILHSKNGLSKRDGLSVVV